jgi:hypothetical protein
MAGIQRCLCGEQGCIGSMLGFKVCVCVCVCVCVWCVLRQRFRGGATSCCGQVSTDTRMCVLFLCGVCVLVCNLFMLVCVCWCVYACVRVRVCVCVAQHLPFGEQVKRLRSVEPYVMLAFMEQHPDVLLVDLDGQVCVCGWVGGDDMAALQPDVMMCRGPQMPDGVCVVEEGGRALASSRHFQRGEVVCEAMSQVCVCVPEWCVPMYVCVLCACVWALVGTVCMCGHVSPCYINTYCHMLPN